MMTKIKYLLLKLKLYFLNFRSIQAVAKDIDTLTCLLRERYPDDTDLKLWINVYCEKHYPVLEDYIRNPSELQREYNKLKEELKSIQTRYIQLQEDYKSLQEKLKTTKQSSSTPRQTQYDIIKKQIQQSISDDRRTTGEFSYNQQSTIENCFESLKTIDKLIKSDKRNIILNSAQKGQILKDIKKLNKKKRIYENTNKSRF